MLKINIFKFLGNKVLEEYRKIKNFQIFQVFTGFQK